LKTHKTSKNSGYSKGATETSAVWITAFDYLVGSQIQLFACDSEGSLYVFESGDNRTGKGDKANDVADWRDSKDVTFSFLSNQPGIH